MAPSAPSTLPLFEVRLAAPDIGPWIEGNTGIPGFTSRTTRRPGPHVVLLGLAHGNEIAGAVALDRLLAADLVPTRGRLTSVSSTWQRTSGLIRGSRRCRGSSTRTSTGYGRRPC